MNRALILLILASIFGNAAGALYTPIHAAFVDKVGGSLVDAGLTSSVYFMTVGFLIFVFGKLADKFGKYKLLITGFILLTVGDVYFIFIQNTTMLIVGQIILGTGLAMTNPSWNGLFSLLLESGKESTWWGTWELCISLSIAIAALFGGLIATNLGFAAVFIGKAILHTGSTIAAFALGSETCNKKY